MQVGKLTGGLKLPAKQACCAASIQYKGETPSVTVRHMCMSLCASNPCAFALLLPGSRRCHLVSSKLYIGYLIHTVKLPFQVWARGAGPKSPGTAGCQACANVPVSVAKVRI